MGEVWLAKRKESTNFCLTEVDLNLSKRDLKLSFCQRYLNQVCYKEERNINCGVFPQRDDTSMCNLDPPRVPDSRQDEDLTKEPQFLSEPFLREVLCVPDLKHL